MGWTNWTTYGGIIVKLSIAELLQTTARRKVKVSNRSSSFGVWARLLLKGPVVLDQFGPNGPPRVNQSPQKITKNCNYSSSQLSYGEEIIEFESLVSEHGSFSNLVSFLDTASSLEISHNVG